MGIGKTPHENAGQRRGHDEPRTDWRTKLQPRKPIEVNMTTLATMMMADLDSRGEAYQPFSSWCSAHLDRDFGAESARMLERPEVIEAILLARREDGYAAMTLHAMRSNLVRLGDFAVAIGAAVKNAVREIRPGTLPRRRAKDPRRGEKLALSSTAMARLVFSDQIPVWRRFAWAMAGLHGLRRGELSGLIQSDVDLSARPLPRLTVSRQLHKSGKIGPTKERAEKILPLHPIALDLLQKVWPLWIEHTGAEAQPNAPLVPFLASGENRLNKMRPWSSSSMINKLREDLAAIGVPESPAGKRAPHVFRYTAITLYRAAGVDPDLLQTWTHPVAAQDLRGAHSKYVTFPWQFQCEQMVLLKLSRSDQLALI